MPHECCFLKSLFFRLDQPMHMHSHNALMTVHAHRLVQPQVSMGTRDSNGRCSDFSNQRLALSFRRTIPPYCVLQFIPFISIGVNSLCISIDIPCVPMCILPTLSALNSIENYYYHIEFRMDGMHIGTQGFKIAIKIKHLLKKVP